MTICQVFGCSNKPNSRRDLSFFQIPDPKKRPEICKKWLHNIKNAKFDYKTFVPNKVFVVCETHFEADCFEENRQATLLGYTPRCKKLRENAVPTIFSFKPKTKRRESTEKRLDSAKKKEILDTLLGSNPLDLDTTTTEAVLPVTEDADVDQPSTSNLGDVHHLDTSSINLSDSDCSPPSDVQRSRPSRRKRRRIHNKKGRAPVQTQTSDQTCQTYASFTSMCSKETQTDIVHVRDDPSEGRAPAPEPSSAAFMDSVLADHTYCAPHIVTVNNVNEPPEMENVVPEECVTDTDGSFDLDTDSEYSDYDIHDCHDEDFDDDGEDQSSSEYTQSSSESLSETSMDDIETEMNFCTEKKYIVFDTMLDKLMYSLKCPFCTGAVDSVQKSFVGSMVRATIICSNGHEVMKWTSKPTIGQAPVGNLIGAASILCSGNTFSHISHFTNLFGLQFFGKTTYYEIQKSLLVPAINTSYLTHMKDLHQNYKGQSVEVSGDGRCDSPGYNAKYGSYTLMHSRTNEILTMALVQVSEVKNSNAMEKAGCVRTIDHLQSQGITVAQLATDRHAGISKLMRENYTNVVHQYDVWHLTKSIKKKLTAKAKQTENEPLFDWIKAISNQIWYACQHCNEDPAILTEKIHSIAHHIANIHRWDGELVNCCDHATLSNEDARSKKWIAAGSAPHKALQDVLFNKRLVKDFPRLTKACHTGQLEVFHSLLLKYCPKRQEFDYPQMLARLQLAVLDHNNNLDRQEATCTKKAPDGSTVTVKRYRHIYSKLTKMWVSKKIMQGKSYDYVWDIMIDVLKAKQGEINLAQPTLPELPANIAPIPRPSKEVLIANADKSRFSKK